MVVAGTGLGQGRAILAVGNYDHTLYALDAATGERLWTFTTGGPVYAAPVFFREADRVLVLRPRPIAWSMRSMRPMAGRHGSIR